MRRWIPILLATTVLAACGQPEPERGPIDITVYDASGNPANGLDVVLNNKKGVVLQVTRTDGDGVARFTGAPRESMVTVARRELYPYHLQTVTRVQPNDSVTFGQPADDPTLATLNITFTAQHPSAKAYLIDAGCSTAVMDQYQPTVLVEVPRGCADDDGNVSVVVYATDEDWIIHGYTFAVDVTLEADETLINLPDWTNDRTTFNIDIPFVPWGTIGYTRARMLSPTDSFLGAGSIPLEDLERSYVIDSTDAIESDFTLPTGFQQALGYSVEIFGNTREAFIAARDDSQPAARTFDLEKEFGLFPEEVDLTLTRDSDAISRPSASWVLNGESTADVAGLELLWADGPGQPVEFRWDIITPPGETSIQAPAMPQELVRFTPLVGDEYRSAAVWLREADFITHHTQYFQYQPFFEDPDRRFEAFPTAFEMRSALERTNFQ